MITSPYDLGRAFRGAEIISGEMRHIDRRCKYQRKSNLGFSI
jgi:hypothetical protein